MGAANAIPSRYKRKSLLSVVMAMIESATMIAMMITKRRFFMLFPVWCGDMVIENHTLLYYSALMVST